MDSEPHFCISIYIITTTSLYFNATIPYFLTISPYFSTTIPFFATTSSHLSPTIPYFITTSSFFGTNIPFLVTTSTLQKYVHGFPSYKEDFSGKAAKRFIYRKGWCGSRASIPAPVFLLRISKTLFLDRIRYFSGIIFAAYANDRCACSQTPSRVAVFVFYRDVGTLRLLPDAWHLRALHD